MPAQYLLPGLANVYGKVMTDVTPAIDFLDDGLNLIEVIRDPGLSEEQAQLNAIDSFVNLMETPMLQTMVDQSAIHEWWLDIFDPGCEICWVFPH